MLDIQKTAISNQDISIDDILEHRVHIGASTKIPTVPGVALLQVNNLNIIDPLLIQRSLHNIQGILYRMATGGKKMLIVDVDPASSQISRETAQQAGEHYCTTTWKAGLITNASTVFKLSFKLEQMKKDLEKNATSMRKKDRNLLLKNIDRIEKVLGGIGQIKSRPDVVISKSCEANKLAINEAIKSGCLVIILSDTNSYKMFDHKASNVMTITMNTASEESLEFILKKIFDCILAGRRDGIKKKTGTDMSRIFETKAVKSKKDKKEDASL